MIVLWLILAASCLTLNLNRFKIVQTKFANYLQEIFRSSFKVSAVYHSDNDHINSISLTLFQGSLISINNIIMDKKYYETNDTKAYLAATQN